MLSKHPPRVISLYLLLFFPLTLFSSHSFFLSLFFPLTLNIFPKIPLILYIFYDILFCVYFWDLL